MMESFPCSIDTTTPVLVAYHGGNGALAIARTLGRLGIPVYLAAKKNASPLVQSSRYWRDRFWWDFSAPPQETLEFLLNAGERIGGRPVLLTLADWVAVFIERNADALASRFVFPRAHKPVIERLADKWGMYDLARRHGIPTPQTCFPRSRGEVVELLRSAAFPIVMKTADPFAPHVPGKAIVRDASALLQKWDDEERKGPPNFILQEYIPGEARDVWMCNAYFTHDSQCRSIFTGRKLRQVDETGVASLARCERNDAVAELTRRFMQSAGYAGAVGIGWRYDARDSAYKVLDVNPRVSGVFRLFRATNGLDVVRACYLDLTGQPVPDTALTEGRAWMLEDDFFAARALNIGLVPWLRSLRDVRETQWFAFDDPRPGIAWANLQMRTRVLPKIGRLSQRVRPRAFTEPRTAK